MKKGKYVVLSLGEAQTIYDTKQDAEASVQQKVNGGHMGEWVICKIEGGKHIAQKTAVVVTEVE